MGIRKLKQIASFAVILALLFATACNGASPTSTDEGTKKDPAPSNTANETKTATVYPAGKFSPSIEVSIGRKTKQNQKFPAGESYDNNAVYKKIEQDLGIKIKNAWQVDESQYDQKVNTSIAANDIPDLLYVKDIQLKQLVEADMIMDLTELFDKHATPEAKKFFTEGIAKKQLDTGKFSGKQMALPFTNSPYNYSSYLYVRKDWLDKLGLPEPKTMQDVLNISETFSKQNPGGKSKTYGLALSKNIYSDAFGTIPFFNGYHAYPKMWIKDSSGKLVYGSIQPEMKTALKQLQDMFKAGQIDPEFIVKDEAKENELAANEQLGMAYGQFWVINWPLRMSMIKDGKVTQQWESYPLPSIDGTPAKTQVGLGVDGYYVVSKKAKNPEALIAIINKMVEITLSGFTKPIEETDPDYVYVAPDNWFINPVIFYTVEQRLKDGELIPQAIAKKDPSILLPNQKQGFEEVMKYVDEGDVNFYVSYSQAKPGGVLDIMYRYGKENRYFYNEFTGAQTATMADKKTTLDAKELEVFTKIIANQAPIEEFDKFVETWKSLGGDQMTKEVNDWHAKQK